MRLPWTLILIPFVMGSVLYAQQSPVSDRSSLADRQGVVRSFRELMLENGFHHNERTGLSYYSGYKYETLYDIDLYFEGIILYYMGIGEYTKNGISLFLDAQQHEGFIPRCMFRTTVGVSTEESLEHCKPFLAQTAVLISDYEGDYAWISPEMFHKLRRYLNYWLDNNDRNGNGLSEWNSAPHGGADNQFERAGGWQANYSEAVDLNCYLYRECLALAKIADRVRQPRQAIDLREAAEARKAAVLTLWDHHDQIFYDRHRRTGKPIKVKYLMSFMTLWAEIATKEQAEASVNRYLLNENHFWTPWPLATYSLTEPTFCQIKKAGDYSRCNFRGSVWMPYNYWIMHGMRKYGFQKAAGELAQKSYLLWTLTDKRREWFNSETGEGYGKDPFWGFSGLAPFMSPEVDLDCDPTALDDPRLREKMDKVRETLGTLAAGKD